MDIWSLFVCRSYKGEHDQYENTIHLTYKELNRQLDTKVFERQRLTTERVNIFDIKQIFRRLVPIEKEDLNQPHCAFFERGETYKFDFSDGLELWFAITLL
jgi:hypothetical protein